MSNKSSRNLQIVGLLLVAIAVLVAAAGCGSRATLVGKYHPSDYPTHTLEFLADGTVLLSHTSGSDQIVDVRGQYRVSGKQVVFWGDSYCGPTEGTYTWAFDGKTLEFAAVSDGCGDRISTLIGTKFQKE